MSVSVSVTSLAWNIRSRASTAARKVLRSRNVTLNVPLKVRLHLVSRVLSKAAISSSSTSFAAQPDVLVVPDGFFGQTIKD